MQVKDNITEMQEKESFQVRDIVTEKESYESCVLCPRECKVNRWNKELGYCRRTSQLYVGRAGLHMWEEPCISGKHPGSGAVFYAGCKFGCVFCQNINISRGDGGVGITVKRLAQIFLELQKSGAANLNLVTPTHYAPSIVKAIQMAKEMGCDLPVIYNSSGYEKVSTLRLMEGSVDVYLPDLKYMSDELAKKYSFAPDYPEVCKKAICEMKRQQPNDVIENGIMKKGLIVRHLVLPTLTKDSEQIIDWVYENLSNKTYFSLMSQYVPCGNAKNFPEINRRVLPLEYKILVNKLISLDFVNAFVQDFSSANNCFTPNFEIFED